MNINRRSFFRRLGVLASLSAYAPLLSFKRAKALKITPPIPPYRLLPNGDAIINPDWTHAPYEIGFLISYERWEVYGNTKETSAWLPYRFRDEQSARHFISQMGNNSHIKSISEIRCSDKLV